MQETDPYEPLDAADHTAYQPPAEPSYGWLLLRGFCTSAGSQRGFCNSAAAAVRRS